MRPETAPAPVSGENHLVEESMGSTGAQSSGQVLIRRRSALDSEGPGRFQLASLIAILAAAVPYGWVLWVLWGNGPDPLRSVSPGSVYDVQAHAILGGHLSLPRGSIGIEAFVHDGRTYTYFGLFPSLIRLPVLLFTHGLDGHLTTISIGVSWVVTATFSALLLWRVRIVVRGDAPMGWAEAGSYGVLLASILVGSVLVFLASQPEVYSEDLAWSVALACGSLFALLGVVERPSWARVTASGVLILLTNLNRSTTGYACIVGALLIAAWFALGRAGPERRRWALPLTFTAVLALLVGSLVDVAKFSIPFGFPASEQLLYRGYGLSQINGGHYFSLRFLPSTLQAYVDPTNLRVTRLFPFVTFPAIPEHPVAHTLLFQRLPTSDVLTSMPVLFGLGIWGVIAVFRPNQPVAVRGLRILLVVASASAAAVMIFGWIAERFVADFMPLLVMASVIGMVDIWRRMDGRRRAARAVTVSAVGLLALFGVVANLGMATTPAGGWTRTQLVHFVQTEVDVSNVTGHPVARNIYRGEKYPARSSPAQLFVRGRCTAVYVSGQGGLTNPYFPEVTWLLVERGSDRALCPSLIGIRHQPVVPERVATR